MLPSLLTALFFALSSLFANKSLKAVGMTRANIGRLIVAAVVLGALAHTVGSGLHGAGRNWLLLSGVVGMGIGDMAFFGALPFLGSRLTVLMTQCLAAPIGALVEWLWLGTRVSPLHLVAGAIILAGVALALMPSRSNPPRVALKPVGFILGLVAAAGQGVGAVISREAAEVAGRAGQSIDGMTAAYQRTLGGLLLTLGYFAVRYALRRRRGLPADTPADATWPKHGWIVVNSACGAIIGVSCYQWALLTTPSAIVLPVVACTPLIVVPFAYWIEGERPSLRSLSGGLLAVVGAALLGLAS